MRTPTELEKSWIAGFFDGEGSVSIFKILRSNGRYTEYKMTVSIAQKNKIPLEFIQEIYGGNLSQDKSNGCWHWTRSAQQAKVFLESIRPYLRYKADQVDVALTFQNRKQQSKLCRAAKFIDEREMFKRLNENDRILIRDLKLVVS